VRPWLLLLLQCVLLQCVLLQCVLLLPAPLEKLVEVIRHPGGGSSNSSSSHRSYRRRCWSRLRWIWCPC
jgi:hypothetical protein